MQEVDTLVQYVISPIWTYFANLKSEKWNLATIFLFLLILFQDVSWHALKIYFDMIWITKKKYNLIIKNPWTIFLTNFYIFLKYFPLCYTPILCSILIVMVTMKIARYNAKAKFNFWSHQSARDTEQDERIFCRTCYCTMESKKFWSRICHSIKSKYICTLIFWFFWFV